MWSLHVPLVAVCVLSGYFFVLPKSKFMHVKLIGYSKLAIDLKGFLSIPPVVVG